MAAVVDSGVSVRTMGWIDHIWEHIGPPGSLVTTGTLIAVAIIACCELFPMEGWTHLRSSHIVHPIVC